MELIALAESQQGLFTRSQARALGLTDRRLDHLCTSGLVERTLPEVFRFCGTPVDPGQRLRAATLAIPGALASHRSAASLHRIKGFERAPCEVVVQRWHRRRLGSMGIIVHETKDLVAADVDVQATVPCTSLVRTLVDLPAVVHEFKAGVALDQAKRRDEAIIGRVAARHLEVARRGRNGTVKLRTLLTERGVIDQKVDSGFERLALRLIASSSLPAPVTQHPVRDADETCYLDLAWPDRLVGMECDSLEHHLSEAAFRWERRRRRLLNRLGWTVLEFTYREVTKEPAMVLAELHRHLGHPLTT